MSHQRIILANSSRLLRELLGRTLVRSGDVEIVREIDDHRDLPAAIDEQDAEWVIVSLPANDEPPAWIDTYMRSHPFVRFLTVSADGNLIKMKWMESHEMDLSDLSLPELIHILESDPGQSSGG